MYHPSQRSDMENPGAIISDTSPARVPDSRRLTGQHVTLKRMTESDLPGLWSAVGSHAEVFTYWPGGPYGDLSQFADSLRQISVDEPDVVVYTVFKRKEALGCLFLLPTDLKNRVMEIGALYGPALQKSREATEAIYLGARLAFDELNNRRLAWKTSSINQPSQRAAERLGFTFEGRLRQHGIQKGRNRDTMWYSIIDSEWPLCKRAFELWLEDGNFDEQENQRQRLDDIRRWVASGEHVPAEE